MKILTSFFKILFLFIFALNFVHAADNENLSGQDIAYIKNALQQNIDFYKENGSFINLKTIAPIEKESLLKKIKKNGAVSLFPNKETFQFFIKYLTRITKTPSSYFDKEIKFKGKKNSYGFTLFKNDSGITININIVSPTGVEGFEFSESSYMYSFEKTNGEILLSKMNLAG